MRKGRFVATYTPAATANYETLVKLFYTQSCNDCMLTGQIKAEIKAFYPIPKSTSKKQRQAMLDGIVRPTKKPDWDNIGKIICDAINSLAYKDDSAIVSGKVDKFYSENPRVEVTLTEL